MMRISQQLTMLAIVATLSLGLSGCEIFGPSRPGATRDYTPVFAAASAGDLDVVEPALDGDPKLIRRTDWRGNTLLHDAVEKKQLSMARLLLDRRADVNARNANGFTALHSAAQNGDVPMIVFLLSRHAKLNLEDRRGRTPWDVAIAWKHPDAADQLRKSGARHGHPAN